MHLKTGWKRDVLHDEKHLWFITPASVYNPAILQRYYTLLNAKKREQLGRFFQTEFSMFLDAQSAGPLPAQ